MFDSNSDDDSVEENYSQDKYEQKTTYLSEYENSILKLIMNDKPNIIVDYQFEKNSKLVKLNVVETNNNSKSKPVAYSIFISTYDIDYSKSYKEGIPDVCIYPNLFASSINNKDLFNKINIKLSKVFGKLSNDKDGEKIKFFVSQEINIKNILKSDESWVKFKKKNNIRNKNNDDTSELNLSYLQLIHYSKRIIGNALNKDMEMNNTSFLNYTDHLGIFNEYRKYDKSNLIYENITKSLINSKNKQLISKKLDDIPKNLLYNKKQIVDIIINQIKSINENKSYSHYIDIPNSFFNFEFEINIFTSKNVNIKLKLSIDSELFPFYPPKLNIISPEVELTMVASISNLSVLRIENWNPTINLEWLVINLAKNMDNIDEYVSPVISNLEKEIMEFGIMIDENVEIINFEFDYKKFKFTDNKNEDNKFWKSGVGYGYSGRNNWDIKEYVKNNENLSISRSNKLLELLNEFKNYEKEKLNEILNSNKSILLKYICNNIQNTTLLEINKNINLYHVIIKLTLNIFKIMESNQKWKKQNEEWKLKIGNGIKSIHEDITLILETVDEQEKLGLYVSFISLFDTIKEEYTKLQFNAKKLKEEKSMSNLFKELDLDNNQIKPETVDQYCDYVRNAQLEIFKNYEIESKHRFYKNKNSKDLNPKTILRISSELSSLKKNLPTNWDTSVIFKGSQKNINIFTFIITGPKDTPYHNGIFEFHGYFPDDYPNTEPKILIDTTGDGSVRFNPNLYNCGKVCLSLLGTWNGSGAEKWNSSTSTLLQVVVSIQSLILVSEPYFNEPGWERQMHSSEGKRKSFDYSDKIRIETIRWAIIDKIKNPVKGFEDITRKHFLLKKREILKITKVWLEETNKVNEMKKLRNELIEVLNGLTDSEIDDLSSESNNSIFMDEKKIVPIENSKYDCKMSLTESNNSESTIESDIKKSPIMMAQSSTKYIPLTPTDTPPESPPISPPKFDFDDSNQKIESTNLSKNIMISSEFLDGETTIEQLSKNIIKNSLKDLKKKINKNTDSDSKEEDDDWDV